MQPDDHANESEEDDKRAHDERRRVELAPVHQDVECSRQDEGDEHGGDGAHQGDDEAKVGHSDGEDGGEDNEAHAQREGEIAEADEDGLALLVL